MFCENCGAKIEEGSVFCPECGTRMSDIEVSETEVKSEEVQQESVKVMEQEVPQNQQEEPTPVTSEPQVATMFCPNCGTANEEGATFCCNCGAPFGNASNVAQQPKKKLPIIPIVAGVAAVAVVACAAIFVAPKLFKKSSAPIYVKDFEIMSLSGKKPYEFGEEAWFSDYYDLDPNEGANGRVKLTDDEKYIFYAASNVGSEYDLYYRPYGNSKADSTKVAGGIRRYHLLKNNNVVYETADAKLYVWNMKKKDKNKVVSNVDNWYISDDDNTIMWTERDNGESDCYVIDTALKKDKNKIFSYSGSLVYLSDDFNEIIFSEDDDLYVVKNKKDKNKIKSNVSNAFTIKNGEDVQLFFTESEESELVLSDFVDDDMSKEDAHITEPDITKYQHEETKESFWGTRTETVTDESYYDDLEDYREKCGRDSLRESMDGYTFGTSLDTLYCYDLKKDKEEKIAEDVVDYGTSSKRDCMWYKTIDFENISRVPFSIVQEQGIWDVADDIQENIKKSGAVSVFVNNSVYQVDADGEDLVRFSMWGMAGKAPYVNVYDGNEEILYEIELKSDIANLKEINNETCSLERTTDDGIYYLADVSNGAGDLYFNTEKIASDVAENSLYLMKNHKGLLFLQDKSSSSFEGTLMMYDGKKTKKISDDATGYISSKNGDVAFLVDYNWSRYEGDMKIYKNGKVHDGDDDVSVILYF